MPEFAEVVDDDGISGRQPDLHYRATCTECGTRHEVYKREWRQPVLVDEREMRYVALMRGWNCCYEDAEPSDGFPKDPQN